MKTFILTTKELVELVRNFEADCRDGFVSNDEAYIESVLHGKESENVLANAIEVYFLLQNGASDAD